MGIPVKWRISFLLLTFITRGGLEAARWAGFLSLDPPGAGGQCCRMPDVSKLRGLAGEQRAEERPFVFPEFQKSTSGLPDRCKERTCVRRTLNLTGLCGQ